MSIETNKIVIFLEANPALRSAFLVAFVFLYRAKVVSVGHSFAAAKTTKPPQKALSSAWAKNALERKTF